MAWGRPAATKTVSKKTVSKKTPSRSSSWGRPTSWGRPSSNSSTKKAYTKTPSTTNVGTRPPSVMPGQPGVPTGGTRIVNKASALTRPVNGKAAMLGPAAVVSRAVAGTKKAGPIIKTPAPTAVKSAWTKTAPSNVRPANHMNHPSEGSSVPVNRGGAPTGGRPNTPVGPRTTTPTAVTPTAVTPTPAAPVKPPVKPPVKGNTNPTPGFTSLTGRNVTAGQFNRRRLGRGPLANESLTPEELRRIASQKVNNYG